ncbi:MAG TPA: alpha/beta fold hydrolase [Solimonas sp.]|nr:alpha/beta fold hydrolase [Solimonas sp.]
MTTQDIPLRCADGYPLQATHYPAAGAARGAVVIASALGVPRQFYAAFARFLAGAGYHAITFDYRGIGGSRGGPMAGRDMGMQHWGRQDIEAALAWAAQELHPPRIYLVGHSAGGQLAGLASRSERLNGLVCVAATAPHPGLYPATSRWWLWLLWRVLVPMLSRGRDWFPSRRVGMGPVDVPAGVAREWARWASRPGYMFNPDWEVDIGRYSRLRMPVLSYAFDDDAYASFEAVDALLARYSAAPVERLRVKAGEHGKLGHFGFFRDKHRDTLWAGLVEWLGRSEGMAVAA